MKKEKRQNAVLHDTYFNKPPCLIRLFLIRLALLSGLSASAVYAVGDLLLMEYGLAEGAIAAAISSAVIFTLASLLPSGIVYFLSLGSFAAVFLKDELVEKLTYFFDYLMIRLDSRLLDTERFVIHHEAGGIQTEEGCILGLSLVGILMGILFTACCRTRFHGFYVLLVFATFAAPSFVAEIAGYHPSIAFFAAFFLGFYALRMAYVLEGNPVVQNKGEANDAARRSERSYRRRQGFAILGRRLRGDIPRYMKYSQNAVITAVCAGILMLGIGERVPQGTTFDYEEFFADLQEASADFVSSIEEKWGLDFGSSSAQSEYFSYSQYGDNSGGIGISKPSDSAAPVLDVTLGRNDIPVYLKGDIGVNFKGLNWTTIKDEYDSVSSWEPIKDFYPEYSYLAARQYVTGGNSDDFLPLQKVSVTYRRRTAVTFQPLAVYEPDYKTSEYFDSFGDYVLRTKNGENYLNTIETLALTPDMNFSGIDNTLSASFYSSYVPDAGSMSSGEYMPLIKAYRAYVNDMYMGQYYANIDGLITTLYDKGYIADWMLPNQKAQGICDYFRQNFTYSLSVDNGEGGEVLDNFLYSTKQGHCALFATATTLALRDLGVPARYVTGYVVAGDGEAVDGGYKYTLREKDLHAWVEVYIDNIGWLPFDPTAAVDGFEGMASESVQHGDNSSVTSETTTVTTPPAPVTSPVDEGEDENPAFPEGNDTTIPPVSADGTGEGEGEGQDITDAPKEENPLIPVLITGLCVIAAVALVIVAVRLFVKRLDNAEKKTWTGFRKKPPYRACQEMYKLTMLILDKEGLTPGCELMNDFAVRVDASIFLKGTNVFLVDVMPVFIKCEFGTADLAPVSEEERAAVYKLTAAVYRRYMENKNAFMRFITRISLFL